ncbi:MAG: hypothetical protein U1C19_08205, partial [Methanobacteriaceae archaeon]|nr:hypothetical protein [Methanobacteriaceae archaeon]
MNSIRKRWKDITITESGTGDNKHNSLDVALYDKNGPVNINDRLGTRDFTQADLDGSNNLDFGGSIDAVQISNDGTNNITITILSKTYILRSGEIRTLRFSEQFDTVAFN